MEDVSYDGVTAAAVAAACGVPRAVLADTVTSTMDVAHALGAAGAPSGTLVLAERQTAGRGRNGRAWQSAPGDSLALTLLERPTDPAALAVLSLRLGLAAAPALEPWATGPVWLKWPNDLLVDGGKLGGILVEVRWREQRPEWVAIGIGINVRRPPLDGTAALAAGASRVEILRALVPAVRGVVAVRGELSADELAAFDARDWARGRRVVQPVPGVAAGLSAQGALLVDIGSGVVACAAGSLVFAEA